MSNLSLRSSTRDNDTRILAVARNLANDGADVVLVSKDLPMRVKASSVGLAAESTAPSWPSSPDTPGPTRWRLPEATLIGCSKTA